MAARGSRAERVCARESTPPLIPITGSREWAGSGTCKPWDLPPVIPQYGP